MGFACSSSGVRLPQISMQHVLIATTFDRIVQYDEDLELCLRFLHGVHRTIYHHRGAQLLADLAKAMVEKICCVSKMWVWDLQ